MSYQAFTEDNSIDGQIRRLKIEYQAKKRAEKKSYRENLLFHENMLNRRIKQSDGNFVRWDNIIIAIRNYRLNHYLKWIEHNES